MKFYNPVTAYVEKNCVWNHKDELCSVGARALIVTGRSSARKNGSLDDVTAALDAGQIAYEIFSEVEENPSVETVEKAAEAGKAFGADFVIGIGGGSPIDAAKAIAVLIANPEETGDCMRKKVKELSGLPLVAVPTTCGTGAEITPNAVLTYHDRGTKKSMPYSVFPKFAFIDGKYLVGAPKSLLVNTSVDALAHCVESYLHVKSNTYNRMFSGYGLRLWGNIKDIFLSDAPLSEEDAETLMLISTIAGMAISQTTTSLPHAMSYELTYNKGVPHGKACGVFLAAYLRQYGKEGKEAVTELLSLLGFDTVDAFGDFLKQILGPVSVTEEELTRFAAGLLANTSKLATYPYAVTAEDVDALFRESLIVEA